MDDTWTNEEVQNICQNKCVCLKLEVDSVPCKQFSQIYPVVVVPVTFFIGKNGIPIEIIPGYIQAEDMRLKLLGATQDKVETSSNNEANTSESMTSQSPCEEPLTLPYETTSFSDDEPFKSEQASADTRSAPSPSQTDVVDKEEQVQKLQEKINQRRLDKLKEAEEEEQRREIERRKLGKDVKSMREKQEKMKILKDLEERKKDKQMEIEARRKVREQLAQDRLERNSKFQQEQEEKRREGDIIK
uniref:Thioredoxin domain-containing protein n=1 Tax=Ciona savignyi TaxID=51511 RepID=H2Z2E9_CIOSA